MMVVIHVHVDSKLLKINLFRINMTITPQLHFWVGRHWYRHSIGSCWEQHWVCMIMNKHIEYNNSTLSCLHGVVHNDIIIWTFRLMVHLLSIQKHEKNVPYNCFALLIQLNIFKKCHEEGIFFYHYFNLFH